MGRLPAPTSVKELRGTARPDRLNALEPRPPVLEVGTEPPTWLRGARRHRAWRDLSELLTGQRILTVLDTLALAQLVDAYGDYLEASDLIAGIACGLCGLPITSKIDCTAPPEIDHKGDEPVIIRAGHEPGRRYYTTTTKEGRLMIRPHPAMAARADAWKRVLAMVDRFGMAPAPRARVSATRADDHDPVEDFLSGRRSA